MKRIKNLDGYQKWMLVLTAVLPEHVLPNPQCGERRAL